MPPWFQTGGPASREHAQTFQKSIPNALDLTTRVDHPSKGAVLMEQGSLMSAAWCPKAARPAIDTAAVAEIFTPRKRLRGLLNTQLCLDVGLPNGTRPGRSRRANAQVMPCLRPLDASALDDRDIAGKRRSL